MASALIQNSGIQNRSFCFTGILSDMKRDEVEKLVCRLGGFVHVRVSVGTDYLVKGIRPGATKVRQAANSGTKQITEREFHEMLNPPSREPVLTPLQRANMLANLAGPMTVTAPSLSAPANQPKPTAAPTRRFALGRREQSDGP